MRSLPRLMGGSTNLGEDCLYLNVWTAAKKPDEKLPVMVWIYGGASISGKNRRLAFIRAW